jgi:hypothetical protein
LSKREDDLVIPMARAAVHVCPKYVYDFEKFACQRSGDCFSDVVKDYLDGTFKGPQPEKVAGEWTRLQYRQAHLALSTLTLILMLCAALSRWGGVSVGSSQPPSSAPTPTFLYKIRDLIRHRLF